MESIPLADILLFAAPLAASSVTLAALHWLPWHRGAKPLARTTAYAVGTAVTVGVPVWTMIVAAVLNLPHSELFWAAFLVCNALVSGAVVNVCYWLDSTRAISLDEARDHASQ